MSASQGRAECPERPSNVHVALTLPRQPACSSLSVGSITTTSSAASGSRSSSGAERALGGGQLLAAEEQQVDVRARQRELDHHRERALHVARAEPVHALGVAPARQVALRRHGVEVAGEQHGRAAARAQAGVAEVGDRHAARVQHRGDVLDQARLVARLRRHVDQLEGASGQPLGELVVAHEPAP